MLEMPPNAPGIERRIVPRLADGPPLVLFNDFGRKSTILAIFLKFLQFTLI